MEFRFSCRRSLAANGAAGVHWWCVQLSRGGHRCHMARSVVRGVHSRGGRSCCRAMTLGPWLRGDCVREGAGHLEAGPVTSSVMSQVRGGVWGCECGQRRAQRSASALCTKCQQPAACRTRTHLSSQPSWPQPSGPFVTALAAGLHAVRLPLAGRPPHGWRRTWCTQVHAGAAFSGHAMVLVLHVKLVRSDRVPLPPGRLRAQRRRSGCINLCR